MHLLSLPLLMQSYLLLQKSQQRSAHYPLLLGPTFLPQRRRLASFLLVMTRALLNVALQMRMADSSCHQPYPTAQTRRHLRAAKLMKRR